MRILIEILHPAHVHFFRNAIAEWKTRGDEVLVLSRDKECANDLLDAYEIPYTSISRIGKSKAALFLEMAVRDWRMWRAAQRFKPDVLAGIMGVTIAQVGKVIRKPAVVFYDTENAGITNRVVYPLAHSVCTPACYQGEVNGEHITYSGYHELAYLHPKRFTPNPSVLTKAGLDAKETFYIVRFVSWGASHDIGETGLSLDFKTTLVNTLSQHGRILITSEGELPIELEQYRFSLPPEDMHHFIAFASMLIGESATMASEAAVLGVPAFFISETGRGYTDEEEEKYGLVYNFKATESANAMEKINKLLDQPDLKDEFQKKRHAMLADTVDTTAWLMQYIDRVVKE